MLAVGNEYLLREHVQDGIEERHVRRSDRERPASRYNFGWRSIEDAGEFVYFPVVRADVNRVRVVVRERRGSGVGGSAAERGGEVRRVVVGAGSGGDGYGAV